MFTLAVSFFFHLTSLSPIYPLSLHDALPISDRAPSPLFSSAVPCTEHPALDAGCALVGTRKRNQESPFHRWHSAPRPPHAGRFCLPVPELRAVFAARRP